MSLNEKWPATKIEPRKTEALVPYARNARQHSPAQVDQLAASIKEWGWTTPILVDEENMIIAGHGRILAAQKMGIEEVPVMVARGWTEAQKRAYVLADNRLTELSTWDQDLLRIELDEISLAGLDISLTGFGDLNLDMMPLSPGDEPKEGTEGEVYSRKIEAPIYTPKGNPTVGELYDDSKTKDLVAEIRKAKLPKDVAAFLEKAAERHTVFNFRKIADFYANADEDVQDLMERSALVIIDFDKAIENGFVRVTKRLGDLVARDYPDA
jgi:hypothetical protein